MRNSEWAMDARRTGWIFKNEVLTSSNFEIRKSQRGGFVLASPPRGDFDRALDFIPIAYHIIILRYLLTRVGILVNDGMTTRHDTE
jgi:hypothetical protein